MNEWEWQLLEDKTSEDKLTVAGREVKVGDRVRLHPRKGGDVLDIALAGQVAIIESVEQDYEGKIHVCVVLEEDPGRLGEPNVSLHDAPRFYLPPSMISLCGTPARNNRGAHHGYSQESF